MKGCRGDDVHQQDRPVTFANLTLLRSQEPAATTDMPPADAKRASGTGAKMRSGILSAAVNASQFIKRVSLVRSSADCRLFARS